MADQNSIAGSFEGLKASFRPDRAQGVNKTVQFDFTGREAGSWTASVHDGQFEYHAGAVENPSVTVSADSDDWLAILRGELNGVSAFMSGRLKAQGDLNIMMKFQGWFQQR